MDHETLVGIDLGKHHFHLHGQDRNGKAVFFTNCEVCTVVMKACAGTHHMARKLAS